MRRAWSEAAEAKLRALYASESLTRLAFLLKRTEKAVKSRAKVLGLRKSQRRPFTAAQDAALLARYADENTATLAGDLGRSLSAVYQRATVLGLRKSAAFMASDRSGRVQRGRQDPRMRVSQFKPGQAGWNKGLKGVTGLHPNCRATQFRKGDRLGAAMHNYVPIGTEKIRDGYLCRKVTDDPATYPANRWHPIHRLIWTEANGPVPLGHVVVFKPGRHSTDRDAITLDALELVTRGELMRRNSYHTRYPELAPLIQLRGALNRKINRRARAAEEHA